MSKRTETMERLLQLHKQYEEERKKKNHDELIKRQEAQKQRIAEIEEKCKRVLGSIDINNRNNWTYEILCLAASCDFGSGKRMKERHAKLCGCIDCESIFKANEIKEWANDVYPTPICPYCWDDMVIDDTSGFPITKEFLHAVHLCVIGDVYW